MFRDRYIAISHPHRRGARRETPRRPLASGRGALLRRRRSHLGSVAARRSSAPDVPLCRLVSLFTFLSAVSIPGRVTPDVRMWASCCAMLLVGGFSRGSPVRSPFHSGAAPYSPQSPSSAHRASLLRAATHPSCIRRGLPAEFLRFRDGLLISHQSEPGSIPGGVPPPHGLSHARVALYDGAGRQVFSGISRFPTTPSFQSCSILTSLHFQWLSELPEYLHQYTPFVASRVQKSLQPGDRLKEESRVRRSHIEQTEHMTPTTNHRGPRRRGFYTRFVRVCNQIGRHLCDERLAILGDIWATKNWPLRRLQQKQSGNPGLAMRAAAAGPVASSRPVPARQCSPWAVSFVVGPLERDNTEDGRVRASTSCLRNHNPMGTLQLDLLRIYQFGKKCDDEEYYQIHSFLIQTNHFRNTFHCLLSTQLLKLPLALCSGVNIRTIATKCRDFILAHLVPDDVAGLRPFSEISHFPQLLHSGTSLHSQLN
ncbi:hypothetical protein PR048_033511 [Dryococelus australis]|uniref:SOCS box domain-containing protein n=1 Tax=Dryococelus australis TaxID=614101 RepID=A0ABQ9G0H9_9NEOP|nr:hypothetical protein PR048_033511 [Dryococelus australis]